MKKALLALIGAGVVASMASLAFADGDAAYSANAVGVVKYTIPADGELTCIALPLHPMDTDDAQGRWVFGDTSICEQLAVGSSVYFWSGTAWNVAQKKKVGSNIRWTGGVTNRPVENGEAIFVKGPDGGEAQTISLLGELPTDDTLEYDLTGSDNLDTRAVSLYPVEVVFGETELEAALPVNSSIYFWSGTAWNVAQKKKVGSNIRWTGGVTNRVVKVGEGVFVKSSGDASTVTQDRPFEWN